MPRTALNYVILTILFVHISANEQWWEKVAEKQGPMVCAEEHAPELGRVFDIPWTGGKLCGSETIVHFSCCPGYERTPGKFGCSLVKPLKNLAETAEELGAKQFLYYAEQSGLLPLLTTQGAYTVFVARDAAFESLTKEQEKVLNSSKKSRNRTPVLLYSIADGRITAEDLPASVPTLYREGSASVARYPSGLISVNCIPLVSTNIEAINGIIHVTESLLLSPGRNTITDLLVRRPAEGSSLSITSTALVRAQLSNELRDKKAITLFAPTDEAWEALPPTFMEALMEDPATLKVLLQHHIVDSVWCSSVIAGTAELQSLDRSTLQVSCNASGQFIENAKIVERDLIARNGFVHHIDTVLVPEKVRSLREFLETRGFTYFLKLLNNGGIYPLFERQDSYTFFIPTNEAFETLSNDTITNILTQPQTARAIASFHVSPGKHLTSNAIDGQKLTTLLGQEPTLRLKIHKKRITVESALLTEHDVPCRNSIIQILDKVLFPPRASITEKLSEGNFSIFLNLLNQTEPNLLKTIESPSGIFTVFAPNDNALNTTMPPGMLSRLLLDPILLHKTMARHILPTFVVSKSIKVHLTYSYKSMEGDLITISKDSLNSLTISRIAEVITPDIVATNGILHEVSRLIEI